MTTARLSLITLVNLVILISSPASAASDLGQDCNPKGWLPQLRAWWNPESFWSAQIPAIRQEVENRAKGYQLYLVGRQTHAAIAANEREKSRIELEALEQQLRILRVQTKPIPPEMSKEIEQVLARANEELAKGYARLDESQRQGVVLAIRWGERCIGYAQQQLAKPSR